MDRSIYYMDNEFIFLVLLPASLFDLYKYRIPNELLVAGLFISLIRRLELQGLTSVWPWLAGMIVPLFLYFLLFRLRFFGASDGKLLAVVGSYVGLSDVFFVLLFSLVIGAFLSIIKLVINGSLTTRIMRLGSYISRTAISKNITPYYDINIDGDDGVIPFGIAISLGAILVGC